MPIPCRIALAALLLTITLPFLGAHHAYPLPVFFQEWLACLLGLAAFAPLIAVSDGQRWPVPRIAALPAGLMLLGLLQRVAGIDVVTESVVLFSLYLGWALLIMFATVRIEACLGRERLADALAWALMAGALLVAGTGILQRWAPDIGQPFIYRGLSSLAVINGNLAQANLFADYLWLGIVATLYLHARRRLHLAAMVPAVLMLMALSLLSGSRSVYFYTVAVSAWSAWWAWRSTAAQRSRLIGIAVLLLPALLASQMLLDTLGANVVSAQRIVSQGSYDPLRLTMWRAAVDIFLDHPLLGAGFDSFSREFFLRIERFPINGVGIPEHSHNLLFEFLAEFGLCGVGLLVGCALLWLRSIDMRRGDSATLLALGLLLVLGLHSGLEYPLWYAQFLAIAVIALALGEGQRYTWQATPMHRLVAGLTIAAGSVMLLTLRQDYTRLEEATLEKAADGATLAPQEISDRLTYLYADSLLRPYAAMNFAARIPLSTEDLKARLAIVQEATHFSPIRQGVFLEAAMLQLDGQATAARQLMHRAMLAHPAEIPAARELLESAPSLQGQLRPLMEQLGDQRGQRNF